MKKLIDRIKIDPKWIYAVSTAFIFLKLTNYIPYSWWWIVVLIFWELVVLFAGYIVYKITVMFT